MICGYQCSSRISIDASILVFYYYHSIPVMYVVRGAPEAAEPAPSEAISRSGGNGTGRGYIGMP